LKIEDPNDALVVNSSIIGSQAFHAKGSMFENVTMLAGLGGAVVPLVIHLIARARYRSIDWGAMMFLEGGKPSYRDGARLREGALLAVRMGAVGLLAIALARPTLAPLVAPASGALAESHTAAVMVVDCSASMGYPEIGGTRLDLARSAALQVLSTLKRGDRACLIAAGAGTLPPSVQFTSDLQSVASKVNELKVARGSADMPAAVELGKSILARQDRAVRQLYVICDRQASSWTVATSGTSADNHANISAPSADASGPDLARFAVIPVGGREMEKVAIESVTVLNPPAVAGAPTETEVRLRNYGPSARMGLPLSLRIRGHDAFVTTVNVPANSTSTTDATVSFPAPGSQVLTANIDGASPGAADSMDHVVEVVPPVRVIAIQGGKASDSNDHLLEAALAPYQSSGKKGPDLAQVTRLPFEKWDAGTDLSRFQVVILDDVPQVPDQVDAAGNSALKSLEQFVYGGGGLLIAPGASTRTEEYNRMLYREDGGLLPVLLQPPTSPAPPTSIETATLDTTHPILHFLAGQNAPLQAIVERFVPSTARTASAHVLGSFSTGDPFLIDASYGRGHVVMIMCSLGGEWSTLPLTSLYLPLVQSTTRYLAGGDLPDRNVSIGEELVATFDPALEPPRATVRRPDGAPLETIDAARIDERSEVHYGHTDVPGVYRIFSRQRGKIQTALFSVAPPPAEADPTPLRDDQWHDLAAKYGFELLEPNAKPLAARLAPPVIAGGEWIVLLGCVLGLLVLEMGLTRLWSARRKPETEVPA
jgi:hypothetical protein